MSLRCHVGSVNAVIGISRQPRGRFYFLDRFNPRVIEPSISSNPAKSDLTFSIRSRSERSVDIGAIRDHIVYQYRLSSMLGRQIKNFGLFSASRCESSLLM